MLKHYDFIYISMLKHCTILSTSLCWNTVRFYLYMLGCYSVQSYLYVHLKVEIMYKFVHFYRIQPCTISFLQNGYHKNLYFSGMIHFCEMYVFQLCTRTLKIYLNDLFWKSSGGRSKNRSTSLRFCRYSEIDVSQLPHRSVFKELHYLWMQTVSNMKKANTVQLLSNYSVIYQMIYWFVATNLPNEHYLKHTRYFKGLICSEKYSQWWGFPKSHKNYSHVNKS